MNDSSEPTPQKRDSLIEFLEEKLYDFPFEWEEAEALGFWEPAPESDSTVLSECLTAARWLSVNNGRQLTDQELRHIQACDKCQVWKEKWGVVFKNFAEKRDVRNDQDEQLTMAADPKRQWSLSLGQALAASLLTFAAGGLVFGFLAGQSARQNAKTANEALMESNEKYNLLQAKTDSLRSQLFFPIEESKAKLVQFVSKRSPLYVGGISSLAIVQEALLSQSRSRAVNIPDEELKTLLNVSNRLASQIGLLKTIDEFEFQSMLEQAYADIAMQEFSSAEATIDRLEQEKFDTDKHTAEVINLRANWLASSAERETEVDLVKIELARQKFREAGELGLPNGWLNLYLLESRLLPGQTNPEERQKILDRYLNSEPNDQIKDFVKDAL